MSDPIQQARDDATIDWTAANAAWWDQWCREFVTKVFPVFESRGFSREHAMSVYCQKHTQLRVAELQADVAHLTKMIGDLKVVKLDESDDDSAEDWR